MNKFRASLTPGRFTCLVLIIAALVCLIACGGKNNWREVESPSPSPGTSSTAGAMPASSEKTSGTAPRTSTPIPGVSPAKAADSILINGKIVIMDQADSEVQALAIKNGLVLRTGTNDQILALAGPQTKKIDLRGRTVTPGLVDPHNHLIILGLIGTAYIDINPPAVKSLDDVQKKIAEAVSRTSPGQWVIAQGFLSFEGRSPNKHDLDPISPENPVMLINQGGHLGTVNSYALMLAGVNSRTPNPKFGIIVRDDKGEPTGELVNHVTMDIFRKLWPPDLITPQMYASGMAGLQSKFAAMGVTTFGDVNTRGLEKVQAYCNFARSGKSSIRGYMMNTIEYPKELEGRVEDIKEILYEDDYLRFKGYKFLIDGAGVATFMHEPHNGIANFATWDSKALNEAVSRLHAAGYQCSFHCLGDAAVDMALDAIELAMKAAPRPDPRHRIEHALFMTDADIKRAKALGVVIVTQPQAIRALGDAYIRIMGENRAQKMIPTRTWLDMGIPLALSSDAPSMPWNDPQSTLAGSISRVTWSNKVFGSDQALTIKEAMRAHTIVAAYASFDEKIIGSLEPGKMADVVVWTDDPYALKWQQIAKLTVDLTMVGGKIVYQK